MCNTKVEILPRLGRSDSDTKPHQWRRNWIINWFFNGNTYRSATTNLSDVVQYFFYIRGRIRSIWFHFTFHFVRIVTNIKSEYPHNDWLSLERSVLKWNTRANCIRCLDFVTCTDRVYTWKKRESAASWTRNLRDKKRSRLKIVRNSSDI